MGHCKRQAEQLQLDIKRNGKSLTWCIRSLKTTWTQSTSSSDIYSFDFGQFT